MISLFGGYGGSVLATVDFYVVEIVVNGMSTSFSKDIWVGSSPL